MTEHRFLALDGMRGVAALAVLFFHVCATQAAWVFPHGYLAVDFFFILSGFVIAYAYEARLKRGMPPQQFLAARLIRLYPLIVAGAVLGLLGFIKLYTPNTLAIVFATGLFLVPTPLAPPSEDFMAIPVNPPSWSLFYELVINIVFMMIVKHLNNRVLAAIIACSGVALLLFIVMFGGATFGSRWFDFATGIVRVSFSFFAGVALFRLWQANALASLRVPFPVLLAALVLLFQVPTWPGIDILFDAVAVMIVFPLIVACGANLRASGGASRLCHLGGELSYPIYILQGGIAPHIRDIPPKFGLQGPGALALIVGLVVVYVALCWLALKLYDEPVRRFLTQWRVRVAAS